MTFFNYFFNFRTHLPRTFKDTDWFLVFKGNSKFMNRTDASAT